MKKETLGSKIRKLRIAKNMTQLDLAYHAGITPSNISNIENDKQVPIDVSLKAIASALTITVEELKGEAK